MSDLVSVLDVATEGLTDHTVHASGTRTPADWFFDALAGPRTSAGVRVTPRSALSHGPVWTAVNVLAGDYSRLPINVMLRRIERSEMGVKHRDVWQDQHRVDFLLNHRPNDYQTPQQWKEFMLAATLLWGNGISLIETDERTNPVALHPLMPHVTTAEQLDDRSWVIRSRTKDGREFAVLPEDTFHVRGLSNDGFWGLSPITICRRRIGSGIAADEHGAATWGNGAKPSGWIKLSRDFPLPSRVQWRADHNSVHGGPSNSAKVGFLEPGMEWQDVGMSNKDAEWLDSVKLDREFVADIFLLPHYKLGALENSSVRANIEAQSKEYAECLKRHGRRFEQEGERKLLTQFETAPTTRRFFLKTNYEEIIQGTAKETAETQSLLVRSRIRTRNEARQKLGDNPVEGGDDFENPAIDTVQQPPPDQPAQQPDEDNEAVNELMKSQIAAMVRAERQRVGRLSPDKKRQFYQSYHAHAEPFLAAAARVAGVDWEQPTNLHAAIMQDCEHPTSESLDCKLLLHSIMQGSSNGEQNTD